MSDSFFKNIGGLVSCIGFILTIPLIGSAAWLNMLYGNQCEGLWLYCAIVVSVSAFCGVCCVVWGVTFWKGYEFRSGINYFCALVHMSLFIGACIWGIFIKYNLSCTNSVQRVFFEICFWYVVSIVAIGTIVLCVCVFLLWVFKN
ncbi:MAG: hypothetical protein Hyperionvirus25_27 [Hyperionvirus sp.]|uniref:Transmembrane protein n=1 Tax=Hyperionvirus sp. TaxID=2487770 RepID=A0A3G5ADU6_9VIRU|nr:MAG: hypothetical protein Hyperionvirus25_27 [Hyperionvirus sp.]